MTRALPLYRSAAVLWKAQPNMVAEALETLVKLLLFKSHERLHQIGLKLQLR